MNQPFADAFAHVKQSNSVLLQTHRRDIMKKLIVATVVTTCLLGLAALTVNAKTNSMKITKDEVLKAQQAWADGIVAISKTYLDEGDYEARASKHIEDLYAYEQGNVLFKPTLASEDQFRETFDEALSYFVGGAISEDKGFAIKPWSNARFGEQDIVINTESAIAMGNYYFTPHGEKSEVKVEFTFGYVKDENGTVRINVHHSSLPFSS